MSIAEVTHDTLAHIEETLREEIGLDPATVGRSLIQRAVQRRIQKCGVRDIDSYADRLAASAQELQELVEEVVVPETYFFREPEAIRDVALRIRDGAFRASANVPVRILSVPCSTGEEPYSIAMALLQQGLSPDAATIDAIDVSLEAVRRARESVFRSGSFRGDMGAWTEYFRDSAAGREIDNAARAFVSVEHGNLMSPAFQPPRERYDVVFCRNLLIYFDEHAQARALATLARILATDGVLVVGAADTFAVRRAGFEPMCGSERSFLFQLRKASAESERAEVAAPRPAPRRRTAPPRTPPRATRMSPALTAPAVAAQPARAASHELPDATFEDIARLANEGRLAEVLARGERALREGGTSARLLALLGTTYSAVENADRAEECYRQALFLDPTNEDALLHLALLLDERGAGALGDRLRARARRVYSFRAEGAR